MPGRRTSARNEESPRQKNTLDKPGLERIFSMKYLLPHFSDKIKFVFLKNYSLETTSSSPSYFWIVF